MTLRPLALTAIALGLMVGIVAALVIPTTRAGTPRGAGATPAAAIPGIDTVVRVLPARRIHGDVEIRPAGPARIEARAADPLGGPDWAVRVFEAERVTRKGTRRPGVSPVVGHPLCAQVGRIHDGRFGWLEADGTFRPLRLGAQGGGVADCGSRLADLHGAPVLSTLSPITEPHAPAARVKTTIAWGLAGSAAENVTLKWGTRTLTPKRTRHNAYVIALGPEVSQRSITGTATYPGGRRVTLGAGRFAPVTGVGGPSGTAVLGARAPDPNGGLPFAMTVSRSSNGTWCFMTGGRVVGDRVGGVDYARDILTERLLTGGGGCGGDAEAFKEHPVLVGTVAVGGTTPEEGEDTGGTGRVARRTQKGTQLLSGRAAPGVVAVTIETPRDVRTLIPSGPGHAILAAYDGRFPTGTIRIRARFKDGHVVADEVPGGP